MPPFRAKKDVSNVEEKEAFRMNDYTRKNLRNRKRRIERQEFRVLRQGHGRKALAEAVGRRKGTRGRQSGGRSIVGTVQPPS